MRIHMITACPIIPRGITVLSHLRMRIVNIINNIRAMTYTHAPNPTCACAPRRFTPISDNEAAHAHLYDVYGRSYIKIRSNERLGE